MSSLGEAETPLGGPAAIDRRAGARSAARPVFGEVMGLVAVTLGFTALGAYIGRDLGGGWGVVAFVVGFVLLLALDAVVQRSRSAGMTLLFAIGLLLGLVLGPGLAAYTAARPAAVWQAAGSTALFVAALGSYGWATRRDLAPVARLAFWALVALLVFGIVAVFVSIPGTNLIWSLGGLLVFGGLTAFDFQRLRTAGEDEAVPIAASIFLDVLNVFQFFLVLLGGGGDD